jgi:hypothetical protein
MKLLPEPIKIRAIGSLELRLELWVWFKTRRVLWEDFEKIKWATVYAQN